MSEGNVGAKKLTGIVKFYSRPKGYGFISRAGEQDVFIHATDLPQGVVDLAQDQKLAFTVEDKRGKGPRARNVELL